MSINFATLQGLTIPEGVVTQITDASGRVLWKLANDKPIILEVEKITSSTYAAETEYTDEQFILLDIYPKTNGTVSVTYGGLTKTITDTSGVENPNAQQVFFGTFNGVSDSVETPASGTLTIEGDHNGFATGQYIQKGKAMNSTLYCGCITAVSDWGGINTIYNGAFRSCTKLAPVSLPDRITSIGNNAFSGCTSLALTSLPSGLTSIGDYAFYSCTSLAFTSLPSGLTSIGSSAFGICTKLALTSLPSGLTSIGDYAFNGCTSLAFTSLPSGLTSIGSGAFSGCTSLALTSLPSGLTSIVSSAFSGCTNLALTSLPNSITSIGDSAFNGCTSLALTSLPSGLESIGNSAFYNCTGVSIAEIPANVTTIGDQAFMCISSIVIYDSLILPNGLLTLGQVCFITYDVNSTSVPTNLSRVKNITVLATTPPAMTLAENSTSGAFGESGKHGITKIVVPKGCGNAYKTTSGWSLYADYIVEAS